MSDYVQGEFLELTFTLNYYYLDSLEMDYYLMAPMLDGGYTFSYLEGTLGHEITWEFLSGYLKRYELIIDSELWTNGSFQYRRNGVKFTTNVDGLLSGSHNITLKSYNDTDLVYTHSIILTVIPALLPLVILSTIAAIVIGCYVQKKERLREGLKPLSLL